MNGRLRGRARRYEAICLLLGYASYIVFMTFNERLLGTLSEVVKEEAPAARIQRASVAAIEEEQNDE
eukprot:SAG11_NODE_9902_length_871_cov_1.243523_2_plen_66_part_01